ncbi:hypothetical protein [Vibrio gallaecicus]|nr:hypothetical protein [Vibrio gallaecicus]MDN3613160.1 hypothetical protein [Vibrio gallaecicus]
MKTRLFWISLHLHYLQIKLPGIDCFTTILGGLVVIQWLTR